MHCIFFRWYKCVSLHDFVVMLRFKVASYFWQRTDSLFFLCFLHGIETINNDVLSWVDLRLTKIDRFTQSCSIRIDKTQSILAHKNSSITLQKNCVRIINNILIGFHWWTLHWKLPTYSSLKLLKEDKKNI